MDTHKRFRHLAVFLSTASAACATGYSDQEAPESGTLVVVEEADDAKAETCPTIDENACLVSDLAACCVSASIKYEYEWLAAKKQGDAEATEANYDRLIELLDHGCALGSHDACRTLQQMEPTAR